MLTGICSYCHEPCDVEVHDVGIGRYEFWGKPCVDSRHEVVSNCCNEPVHDESGHVIGLREFNTYMEEFYYNETM